MKTLDRYIPQTRLPEIGVDGQRKLLNSSVFVIGCGALGSPTAMYLTGAGIGKICIADFDNADFSNLHRQVFFSEKEVGTNKAEILKRRMLELNSEIEVSAISKFITLKSLSGADNFSLIVDAADNPSTTYMLSEYCHNSKIPLVIGGVSGWEAQIFVQMPDSAVYGDIFLKPEETTGVLPCSLTGITGPTAAFAASLQSAAAIKIILGLEGNSSNLIKADLLSGEIQKAIID